VAGPGAFHLRKWYLDLTTEVGDAVVVYQAVVRWRAVRFRYASVLVGPRTGGPAKSRTTLSPGAEPVEENGLVCWSCDRLGLAGTWAKRAPSITRTLLNTDAGVVQWRCVLPAAEARISVGAASWQGLGYVEVLDLTIPPWSLPIRELRWGRFLAPGCSVVWIDWRGRAAMSLAFVDGVEHAATIGDDGVRAGGVDLRMDQTRVVRAGRLGATVLGKVPGLVRVLPAPIVRTDEVKWVSAGAIHEPAGDVRGWAIHERVVFGGAGP
jgi:hypothetical protein